MGGAAIVSAAVVGATIEVFVSMVKFLRML